MFRLLIAAALIGLTAPATAAPCDDYRATIDRSFDAALALASTKARRTIALALTGARFDAEKVTKRAGEVYAQDAAAALIDRQYQLDLLGKVCP